MKRVISCILTVCILVTSMVISNVVVSGLTGECIDANGTNVNSQNYEKFGDTVKSYFYDENGILMTLRANAVKDKYVAEYYTDDLALVKAVSIDKELPIFGAFYSNDNYYFVLSGQENPQCDDSVETYRITKYDKDWNKLGCDSIYGANTTIPFDAGSARVAEASGYLVVHSAHEMYNGHQANITLQFDIENAKFSQCFTGVWDISKGYVSHSFNQFTAIENNKLITVDHGDAYPRAVVLCLYDNDISTGKFYSNCESIEQLTYSGGVGNNDTGVSVGGFEVSSSSYLTLVSAAEDYDKETRNIKCLATNKETKETRVVQLSHYEEGEESASTPQMTKIDDEHFMVLWSRGNNVYYHLINDKGEVITAMGKALEIKNAEISDCKPIIHNGKVMWYTWSDNEEIVYCIDIDDISITENKRITTGHDMEITEGNESDSRTILHCRKCGHTEYLEVPDDFEIRSGSSYQFIINPFEPKFHLNHPEYISISAETENPKSAEFEVLIEDESILSFKKINNSVGVFTANKDGTTKLTVRLKYRPSVAIVYTAEVGHILYECTGSEYTPENFKSPTCTEDGFATYYCCVCAIRVKKSVPALGHDIVETVTKEANCVEDGTKHFACSRCSYNYDETIPSRGGHNFELIKTVQPKCETDGYYQYKCKNCRTTKKETIPATGHKPSDWVVTIEPTCTYNGVKVKNCETCQKKLETQSIPMLEHDYESIVVLPTYTTMGYTKHKCKGCGETYFTDYVDMLVSEPSTEQTTEPATNTSTEATMETVPITENTTDTTTNTQQSIETEQTLPSEQNINTVYFLNTPGWTTINCYAYNNNGNELSVWPGTAMNKTNYKVNGYDIYSVTFDSSLYDNVVFTDGINQSESLIPYAHKCYRIDNDLWFAIEDNIDTEPTLVTENTQPTITESTQATSTQTTDDTQSTEVTEPTQATEVTQSTQATEPTEPTTEAKTTITLKAAKTSIYVGDTTTVKATVTNSNGATTFSSSNTKVATVSSKGVVKGLKAGSVTIIAKNNGKSDSVKITVKQKANTISVKAAAKTVKYATVKKKAVTVSAITVKKAKGVVTYKKASGSAKVTVNKKNGKLTVKKGTKKGTYTVKVKVTAAGNTTYKAGSKIVTVKINVK